MVEERQNPGGGGGPRLKPKNKGNGSVIPAKRRLVKRMVFDSILNFITSLLKKPSQSQNTPPSSTKNQTIT
ncbi:hypothetical protein VitviT2T_027015 [Vitis vinifera]|uniref:Uncharacterized protein n=1 Tax=Vitis vinifera TaxID=29760 RepID=A0ABY9DQJ8_VITVI|nr:hypothetical protein VitviT2T_027015 [Vitis vinifera]